MSIKLDKHGKVFIESLEDGIKTYKKLEELKTYCKTFGIKHYQAPSDAPYMPKMCWAIQCEDL